MRRTNQIPPKTGGLEINTATGQHQAGISIAVHVETQAAVAVREKRLYGLGEQGGANHPQTQRPWRRQGGAVDAQGIGPAEVEARRAYARREARRVGRRNAVSAADGIKVIDVASPP